LITFKIYSRDRRDFNKSVHLSECASDDGESSSSEKGNDEDNNDEETFDGGSSIDSIDSETVYPVPATAGKDIEEKEELSVGSLEPEEDLSHLPDWLQDKFLEIQAKASQERKDLLSEVGGDPPATALRVDGVAATLSPR